VLILLTDDQGYGDFSCHGNPVLKTPAFDKIHKESVRFTDFHSAPMCTPTRGQLLSGLDALHNRATSVTAGRALLRRDLPTMADIFRAGGYTTGLFGKWHLGDNYPYRPMDRGFDEAKYHLGFGISSAPEFDNDYFDGRYRHNGQRKQFSGYCTDFWFSEAITWMDKQKQAGKPFLCYLPTNVPHGPAWVDARYSDRYSGVKGPAAFFGMIANLDENVARLDAFLEKSGLRDNTIVIVMTDNGGTAGVSVFNAGMRGRKTQLYQGGHRVPCFVRWPSGRLRPACDVDTPAQMQDILPTLIDLCALKTTARFDGRSLAALLRNRSAQLPDRMLVVQYGQILKKWESCVIWGKWRLVNGAELYDWKADVGETSNVAAANPTVVSKMRAHYESWWSGIEPTLRDFQPITIGSPYENPVHLCSADWQEVYCDNMNSVLNGLCGTRGGPWNIAVESGGDYEVALSRYDFDRDLPMDAACPVKQLRAGSLPQGKAMPIAQARLQMAGQDLTAKSAPGAKSVSFRLKLNQGKTMLHAWFQDAGGNDLCGAYYARVRKL
jgi:arylsulfatase